MHKLLSLVSKMTRHIVNNDPDNIRAGWLSVGIAVGQLGEAANQKADARQETARGCELRATKQF